MHFLNVLPENHVLRGLRAARVLPKQDGEQSAWAKVFNSCLSRLVFLRTSLTRASLTRASSTREQEAEEDLKPAAKVGPGWVLVLAVAPHFNIWLALQTLARRKSGWLAQQSKGNLMASVRLHAILVHMGSS